MLQVFSIVSVELLPSEICFRLQCMLHISIKINLIRIEEPSRLNDIEACINEPI